MRISHKWPPTALSGTQWKILAKIGGQGTQNPKARLGSMPITHLRAPLNGGGAVDL